MYRKFFKRLIDVTASAAVLILASPVLAAVAVLLHFFNEGAGVFFTQERPGKGGKIFRVVRFGAFVRHSSLDELPQLWNVLKGDMSLIGPRPLLMEYLPLYTPEQMRRHDVRPGISGWAQCHGRNNLSWTEKFKLDVWYVDHVSFRTDVLVVLSTLRGVIKKADIDNDSSSRFTTELFNGKN